MRNDLLHLIRGNGAFACLISGDQLHGWEDSVIAVGFQLVAGSITISWILYTSDAADDLLCVNLGGRRNNKKKNRYQKDL